VVVQRDPLVMHLPGLMLCKILCSSSKVCVQHRGAVPAWAGAGVDVTDQHIRKGQKKSCMIWGWGPPIHHYCYTFSPEARGSLRQPFL
jgi:hypothetical protein